MENDYCISVEIIDSIWLKHNGEAYWPEDKKVLERNDQRVRVFEPLVRSILEQRTRCCACCKDEMSSNKMSIVFDLLEIITCVFFALCPVRLGDAGGL